MIFTYNLDQFSFHMLDCRYVIRLMLLLVSHYILDAYISSKINHEWLLKFIGHRVTDIPTVTTQLTNSVELNLTSFTLSYITSKHSSS